MSERVQIYTDEEGNKSSVIVPYSDWTKLKSRLKSLEKKLKVFASIRDAKHEVVEAAANRDEGCKVCRLLSMRVEVNVTEAFKKAARPLIKKYRSFLDDLESLQAELVANPESGISLGHGVYKVRLRIRSKRKGKSGGARVITLVEVFESGSGSSKSKVVNLLTVYDKGEQTDITDRELKALIDKL